MKRLHTALFLASLLSANLAQAALIRYYPFDGNANDASGNGYDGTVVGATLTTDHLGNPNSAYHFDGSGDYIVAGADNLPTTTRTVALWFEPEAANLPAPIMLGYGGGSCGTSMMLGLYIQDYFVSSHCGANTLVITDSQSPLNAWHHFAMTTDNSGTSFYLDGAFLGSNSSLFINNTVVAGTQLGIGVASSPSGSVPYTDSNIGYFQGSIDDVRIYNTALSAQEIAQLAGKGASVPEPSTLFLFTTGIAGLLWSGKKRNPVM
jgi:hypothetical protein